MRRALRFWLLAASATLLAGCGTPTTTFVSPSSIEPTASPSSSASGLPYAQGAQLIDAQGHPILLRGAMVETSFAYLNQWRAGQDPLAQLNPTTFATMRQWNMNAIRINISGWMYQLPGYLARLDTAVQQATAAGLYAVIDYHSDTQSGSPFGDALLHGQDLPFWKAIASRYGSNPNVLFDVINEPKYRDWQTWLHGDGSGVVGVLDTIAAIRSTGAQQLIVVEPGKAGGSVDAEAGGWSGFPLDAMSDSNLIYSKHDYQNIISGNPQIWDASWGPLLGSRPLYYGEWALLPHARIAYHCRGLTSSNAAGIAYGFLSYMGSRNMNWTAWDFKAGELIVDNVGFAPTSFDSGAPWQCDSSSAASAGMGQVVKNYLSLNPPA